MRNARRLQGARPGPGQVRRAAGRAAPRRRGRRAGRGRGRQGRVAGRAVAARSAVHGPRRVALAVRPAGPGPQAARPALRVRLPARDVQAGRAADLGLLRAPDPATATGWSESSTRRPSATRACSASTPSTRTSRSTTRPRTRWPPRSRTSRAGSISRSCTSTYPPLDEVRADPGSDPHTTPRYSPSGRRSPSGAGPVAAVPRVLLDHLDEHVADRRDPVLGVDDEVQGVGRQPVEEGVGVGARPPARSRTPPRPGPGPPSRRRTGSPSRRRPRTAAGSSRCCSTRANQWCSSRARCRTSPRRDSDDGGTDRRATARRPGRRSSARPPPEVGVPEPEGGQPAWSRGSLTVPSVRRCTRGAGRRGRSAGRTPRSVNHHVSDARARRRARGSASRGRGLTPARRRTTPSAFAISRRQLVNASSTHSWDGSTLLKLRSQSSALPVEPVLARRLRGALNQLCSTRAMCRTRPSRLIVLGGTLRVASCSGLSP